MLLLLSAYTLQFQHVFPVLTPAWLASWTGCCNCHSSVYHTTQNCKLITSVPVLPDAMWDPLLFGWPPGLNNAVQLMDCVYRVRMFSCSSAYRGSEIETLSSMFSGISSFSSGSIFRFTRLLGVREDLLLAWKILYFKVTSSHFQNHGLQSQWCCCHIVSRGLWSVYITMLFPKMYSLNFCVLNMIAYICSLWVYS